MIIYEDLVVHYKKMRSLDAIVDDQPERAGELVRAVIRNRLGWSELEAFQESGEFLLKHPILKKKREFHDLRQMKRKNPADLLDAFVAASKSVTRYNSQIKNKKYKSEEELRNWQNLIEKYNVRLDIITALTEEDNDVI